MANFLVWRVVFSMVEYLHTELRDMRQQFMSAFKGQKREQSRWRVCFQSANANFGMALGSLFIQKHFDRESKAAVSSVFQSSRIRAEPGLNLLRLKERSVQKCKVYK